MANKTKAELLAEATALGITFETEPTNAQIQSYIDNAKKSQGTETPEESPEPTQADLEVEPVPTPTPVMSEGAQIADAIVKGLAATKEDKRIRIVADPSVKSMFSVVRNKQTGEVMLRENSNGVLSRVQLESLEEKESSIQSQEVEEV